MTFTLTGALEEKRQVLTEAASPPVPDLDVMTRRAEMASEAGLTLLAVLETVLKKHQPNRDVIDQWTLCRGCFDSNGEYSRYPCPTVQAMTGRLASENGRPSHG